MNSRRFLGAILWLIASAHVVAEPTPASREPLGTMVRGLARPTPNAKDELAEFIITLDKPSAFLESARKSLEDAVAAIHAESRALPRSEVSKSGGFVLWGDLFKTGGCFALTALVPQGGATSDFYGVAFAEWSDGKWELRGLWKIPPTWRPKGWKASGDDYLPATPASEPFELRDLSGDGVPEVIVAGEVEKYYQENYLLRFARKTHALQLVATAMGKPEVRERYVRLYFNSGRRAIYEEWQFLIWKGDLLVPVASWHNEVGYGTHDPTFSEGQRTGPGGDSETIRVGYGIGQEYDAASYELTRNGKPFGRMRVTWKDEKKRTSLNSDWIEKAWLFEKITRLPRRLYPSDEDSSSVPRLEDFASVTVEGNIEAAKLFSAATK